MKASFGHPFDATYLSFERREFDGLALMSVPLKSLPLKDLLHLRAFAEVARCGSFSEAGRRLNLSTAAVSRSVSNIEAELGARLLMRTTRHIQLTDAGRAYHQAVCAALDALMKASDNLVAEENQVAGTIRAAMPGTWTRSQVLPALSQFLDEHPQVTVELAFHDLLPDLVTGGFDVGVQYSDPIDSSYIARCIQKLRVYLVASPAYLSKHGVPACPADLINHNCINVQTSTGKVTWRMLGNGTDKPSEYLHEPRGRLFICNQLDATVEAAVNSLGISAADISSTLPLLKAGKLRVVLPNFQVAGTERGANKIMMIYPHRNYVPLRVRLFMEFLRRRGEDSAVSAFDPHEFAV